MEWEAANEPDGQEPGFDDRIGEHLLDFLGELGVQGEGHGVGVFLFFYYVFQVSD